VGGGGVAFGSGRVRKAVPGGWEGGWQAFLFERGNILYMAGIFVDAVICDSCTHSDDLYIQTKIYYLLL
jgi:hypothetical protein